MNERNLDVLSQYDMIVEKTARGRGTYLIWTDQGFFQLYEYNGTDSRIKYESELLEYIVNAGFERVDTVVKTKDGELYSKDEIGGKYVLKRWYEGKECDVKKVSDILTSVQTLACLHLCIENVRKQEVKEAVTDENSLVDEYERHNRELKRVRSFIRDRKRKSQFEYDVLAHFDEYYSYAREASNQLLLSQYSQLETESKDKCSICHGTYNYHNIIMEGKNIAVVNFDHSARGVQIRDLYFFLRKIMEKNNWDVALGGQIIEKYNMIKSISDRESNALKIMLSYPEKFWKVLNQYNNSNKAWIPDKNVEKLVSVYNQQELKKEFIKRLWS